MSRHDHLVDLIVKDLKTIHKDRKIYQHTTVEFNWFYQNTSDRDYLKNIPNTPDIVIVNEALNTVFVIEVGCSFDLYLDTCYLSKLLKYQPLVEAKHQLNYQCKLIILVFGSLGHVHNNVIKGLQLGGLQKKKAKKLAKFCSVSVIIGSMQIWKRRCFVYPWVLNVINLRTCECMLAMWTCHLANWLPKVSGFCFLLLVLWIQIKEKMCFLSNNIIRKLLYRELHFYKIII